MKNNYVLLFLLLIYAPCLLAQTARPAVPITLDLNNTFFGNLVQAVEAQSDYHFYYDERQIGNLRVTVQATAQQLPAVLASALRDTGLRFAIDDAHNIFITKETGIATQLPDPRTKVPASVAATLAAVDQDRYGPAYFAALERRLYEIGRGGGQGETSTISGFVYFVGTTDPIPGVAVYVDPSLASTATDARGHYALTLPNGRYTLWVKGLGLRASKRQVLLRGDGRLNVEMGSGTMTLAEVRVEADRDKNVVSTQMGVEKLDIKTIRQVPTALGEADVLRVLLTLPGVKSVGEGNTGLNVRGGSADQNLVLLNGATVYNPSHLFGFFSAFNPDVVDNVELHKAAIPARFGGRLSSVLDITSRGGNGQKLKGAGGIGLLTSRLTLEGPIGSDKTTFLVGGRSTYSDWLMRQLPQKEFNSSSASFYDLNAQLRHEFSPSNSLSFSGYMSKDRFRLASDTVYQYTNQAASLKWTHIVSERLTTAVAGTYSRYHYDISTNGNPALNSNLSYNLLQIGGQADANYLLNDRHTLSAGLSSLLYQVEPGRLLPAGDESLVAPQVLGREKALESAIYAADKITLSPRLSVELGLRYSLYNALGPRSVYRYQEGVSRNEATITDTVAYAANKVLATYHGPEYRASARYVLDENSSVKASYNRTRQYIHMLSNTTTMSPTDVWKLSDANVRPQRGDQLALGYYRNFKQNLIETSVEVYYKKLHDVVDYKSGALLLLNPHIETDIVNARGKAYGAEFLLRKTRGKLNGWLSYTYSRTLVQVKGAAQDETINGGRYYPSNFDKPHDVSLVGNYRFNKRFSTSLNFTYNTGRPITLPLAKYTYGSTTRVYYSDRNAYRVPDYYRVDMGLNIEGNHKIRKLAHSSWTVGVYNLTGRQNPYSIYFKSVGGAIKGYKLSIFGQPIPTVTYNFKF
ncbi:TonB-dependent receptor [Hymenobacter sp. NBH84]|uniref:TonB-dependent receptor n=1 Tax=Hymenobacter sp. NBH84 TaxID=2596915 RepID=UPI0016274665|nr:carboxypeptidase-like regulatory domain-containing protein [Hymenobacter sp. NBH84]QNE39759.1 TonB-dependent receptor [Hymenobacter sp. NBH84]